MGNKSKEKSENRNINPYLTHKPMKYGKKFYISEFLAEKFIQTVAIISIGLILAIFYFVFNESIYAFVETTSSSTDESAVIGENTQSESLKSETYNPNEEIESQTLESETYIPDGMVAPEPLQPETYVPDGESAPVDDLTPMSYGDIETGDIGNANSGHVDESESLEYLEDVPIKPGELIFANDTIEGNPAYVWQPISKKPKFNLMPLFAGSLKVTLIGLFIAAPIALLAAIFTVAFATKRQKEFIKPIIEIIAGFPSVVIGFFALMTLATVFQDIIGNDYRLNAFVAGAGIAIAVIPIIYTVAEDAMTFVPKHVSEASLSLGATRWQTASRVIVPSALPGIFAAVILGFGRAFGETMIVLMATGNAALMSLDIFEPVRTLSATIGAEMAEVEFRGVHYGVLFLIGALLFIITLTLNALAEFYVKKSLIRRIQGKS